MINIVLEGPDASGKSTLAAYLANHLQRTIIPSEGPEKHPGEINERVRRYQIHKGVIFDRHPCVSQPIYGLLAENTPIDQELLDEFYSSSPILIYCSGGSFDKHEATEHDTADHLKAVEENYDRLARLYESWAVKHASYNYILGEPYRDVQSFLLERLDEERF